ncbi:hypothetical protein HMPREF9384_1780 [Streptococcus sanguinis SK160]|uniref:Uncharacterized protein n=1 Tax=Streptococcus sanguinis SK160 TaxID=888812 RepID=F0IVB8_STRSA|nr:hypothetical protein HMPREF9384_1780 [Streptococcus sanguinis SK160]
MHHILFHLTKDTKAIKSKVKIGKLTEFACSEKILSFSHRF